MEWLNTDSKQQMTPFHCQYYSFSKHPASFQQTALGFPWLVSLCPPFSLLEILDQYLAAFHACHGELFHMHWFFVGTDRKTEEVWSNNFASKFCGPVPQLFEKLAAPLCALLLYELWHAAVVCLNTCSHHKCSLESHNVCKVWCQICIAESILFLCTTRSLHPQQDVLSDFTVHKIS